MLGLALTALLASFMSGMAGNVTAFNTVWTYNLYQAFFVPNKSDEHYFWMGKFITVVGIGLSIACAYFARQYNNAMDIIQLVFGFVNAPVFATFLLGMFWKRTTSIAAFCGLFGGIAGSTVFHALTIATGNVPGVKGAYLWSILGQEVPKSCIFPSEMAQNFWLATFAFCVCFGLTLVHFAGNQPHQNRRATEGPRLFAHAENRGPQRARLAAARRRRHRPARRLRHPELYFLVNH